MYQGVHTSDCLACDLGLNSTSAGDLFDRQILANLRSLKYFSEFFQHRKLDDSKEIWEYTALAHI